MSFSTIFKILVKSVAIRFVLNPTCQRQTTRNEQIYDNCQQTPL